MKVFEANSEFYKKLNWRKENEVAKCLFSVILCLLVGKEVTKLCTILQQAISEFSVTVDEK